MRPMRTSTIEVLIMIGLISLSFLTGLVLAAEVEYPTKPVIINVRMAPGASASFGAQIFAERVQKYLAKPQPFIVNHKPGASGMVCTDYFMKQPADGYNLMWLTPESTLSMTREPQKFSFTLKDFSYIGLLYYSPYTLAVNSEGPFKDKAFEDFIDYAKKHPVEMTYSTPGITSGGHFAGEVLQKEAGIKLTHVPFIAGGPGMLAMLGGHVTSNIVTPGTVLSHTKPGGKARILVVFDTKRFPDLPDIPTAKERGYDIVRPTYHMLIAKKGTPKPILDTLVKLHKQVGDDPDVKAALVRTGLIPLNLGPDETEKFITQDCDLFREVFGKLGLLGK